MIPYMPAIYEDELLYSYLARINVHIGFISIVKAKEYFLKSRNVSIDTYYMSYLSDTFKTQLFNRYDEDEIVLEHTLFPFMNMFSKDKSKLLEDIYEGNPISHPQSENKIYLKYCPYCAKEDYIKHNEAYFHTSHQALTFCIKHHCNLIDTNIPACRSSKGKFMSLEEIRIKNFAKKEASERQLRFEQFVFKAFKRKFSINEKMKIRPFDIYKQRYDQSELLKEITEYYSEIGITNHIISPEMLSYVISGKNTDTYKVLQLAYFLNIDIDSLFRT